MSDQKPPSKKHDTRTIEIKLEVPKFSIIESVAKRTHKTVRFLWRYKSFRLGVAIIIIGICFFVIQFFSQNTSKNIEALHKEQDAITQQDVGAQVPYYDTLIPEGKTIEQLGGWTRSSPADRNAGFVYVDYIRENRITVNQQILPTDFKTDINTQMDAIAKSLSATEILTVAGLTVHIATSSKGPQTIIFNKDGLLVFLKSSVKLSSDDWIGYIETLK